MTFVYCIKNGVKITSINLKRSNLINVTPITQVSVMWSSPTVCVAVLYISCGRFIQLLLVLLLLH